MILLVSQTEEYPSPAEGIGLENRQAGQTARGFESLFLLHCYETRPLPEGVFFRKLGKGCGMLWLIRRKIG